MFTKGFLLLAIIAASYCQEHAYSFKTIVQHEQPKQEYNYHTASAEHLPLPVQRKAAPVHEIQDAEGHQSPAQNQAQKYNSQAYQQQYGLGHDSEAYQFFPSQHTNSHEHHALNSAVPSHHEFVPTQHNVASFHQTAPSQESFGHQHQYTHHIPESSPVQQTIDLVPSVESDAHNNFEHHHKGAQEHQFDSNQKAAPSAAPVTNHQFVHHAHESSAPKEFNHQEFAHNALESEGKHQDYPFHHAAPSAAEDAHAHFEYFHHSSDAAPVEHKEHQSAPISEVAGHKQSQSQHTPATAHHGDHDHHIDYYAHPKYEYEYKVEDPHTGDNKFQHETRDGDAVKGVYSFHEADGSIRTVEYNSDKKHGFNAIVKHSAPGQHVHIESHHKN